MKTKLLLTIAATVGLTFTAVAQTLSIGPRVGTTFASTRVNPTQELPEGLSSKSMMNSGLQFGAVARVAFNDRFSVQPELLVIQKGGKGESRHEQGDFIIDADTESVNTYLELPVLAKAYFGTGKVRGFVTAGPTFGYWLKGKILVDFAMTKYGEADLETKPRVRIETDIDFNEQEQNGIITPYKYNRFETGASFGAGAAYHLGPGELNLDVRYGLGISSIRKVEGSDSKARNHVFGISLAYLFSL